VLSLRPDVSPPPQRTQALPVRPCCRPVHNRTTRSSLHLVSCLACPSPASSWQRVHSIAKPGSIPVCIFPFSHTPFADMTAFYSSSYRNISVSVPPVSHLPYASFNAFLIDICFSPITYSAEVFLAERVARYTPLLYLSIMRSRRNPSQPHSLSPYDPSTGATSTTVFPRAVSPSGFSQLLSKPAKWFTRNQTTSRPPPTAPSEPRSSTSSFVRKPKISHPTDLRPILPSMQSEPYIQSPTHSASRLVFDQSRNHCDTHYTLYLRSVFDLSLARAQAGLDGPTSSSPSPGKKGSTDLGDLRGLSHKPWSRSAEELGKFSASAPSTPLSTSFQDKIQQYRIGSPSHSPTAPHPPQQHPFPTFTATSSSADLSSAPSSPVSLSPSLGTPPSGASVPMLHVRSHSFTPKLPSKLSASKICPPITARKASNASERGYDPSAFCKRQGRHGFSTGPRRVAVRFRRWQQDLRA
jgi:hypothetical protein